MSDEGKPLSPEHVFKKIVWRSTLTVGSVLEQATTWTITGVAAILALLISHIDAINKIIPLASLRVGMVLFTLSLLVAIVSRQFGMAIANGLKTLCELENVLHSDDGLRLVRDLKVDVRQLIRELAEPFWWPLSTVFRNAGEKGLSDYLTAEKRLIRFLNWQVCLNALHWLLAGAALLVLAFSV